MPEKPLPVEQILTMLSEAPHRIATLTHGLTAAQLHTAPDDGWSVNDVLAHLRSCADVWGKSIEVILTQDNPTIRAINPRTWINSTDYPKQKIGPSLKAYTAQRAELLSTLKQLKPRSWSRTAMVTGAGKPFVHTVQSYAQRMVVHERSHIKQISRIADAFIVNKE